MRKYDIEVLEDDKIRFTFTNPDFYVVVSNWSFGDETFDIDYNAEVELTGERLTMFESAVSDFIGKHLTEGIDGA